MNTRTKPSRQTYRTGALAALLTILMALSMVAPAVAAPSDDLACTGDDHAPNPYMNVSDLTVAKHPMDEGDSHDAMAGYEDDSGDWVPDPVFEVNTSSSKDSGENVNPYDFKPGHVEAGFYTEFPRTGNSSEYWQNSTLWYTNAGSSNVTVQETTVASGADALQIDTTGTSNVDSGDQVAHVSFDNWASELDSDESKRVIQFAADVDTLNGKVNVTLEDESGDQKNISFDSAASTTSASEIADNSTGDHVYQIKLSKLTTTGGGSWDNIESVNVTVEDGNADLSISWLDVEKKTKTQLGEKKVADSDGDYVNTNTTYNASGDISVHSMSTLDSDYDTASITDVSFPAKFPACQAAGGQGEESAYVLEWEDASDYPNFHRVLNVSYRIHLPAPVDLSYGTIDLRLGQNEPSGRYIAASHELDVNEDANLSQASLTDDTGSLGAKGDDIQMASGVSSDTYAIAHFEVKYSESEVNAIQSTAESGGGAPMEDDSGGFLSTAWGQLTALAGVALGALGLRRFMG